MALTKEQVMDALKNCFDPEIPINVVDLGLIYDVKVSGDEVSIRMTLTSPQCPLAGHIMEDIKRKVEAAGAKKVFVELVFDPPWTPDRISEKTRKEHGF
ncbi:MAG: metal-sulfur cluster assembly factor [Candidatus Aenigmatarchaeota archaeon]